MSTESFDRVFTISQDQYDKIMLEADKAEPIKYTKRNLEEDRKKGLALLTKAFGDIS